MSNTFSHDSNARHDERVLRLRLKHGAAGYGVYFMLLEVMRDNKDYMCVRDYNIIAYDLRVDAALVKAVVEDFGLFDFTPDGKRIYSKSFLERMRHYDAVSQKRSTAGRKGAAAKRAARENREGEPSVPAHEVPTPAPPIVADPISAMLTEGWQDIMCLKFRISPDEFRQYVEQFRVDCRCRDNEPHSVSDAKRHFNDWLRIIKQHEYENNQRKPSDKRRGTDVPSGQDADYSGTF